MAKDLNSWPSKSREQMQKKRIVNSEHHWREGNVFFYRFIVNREHFTGSGPSLRKAKEDAAKKANVELKLEEELV